MHENYLIDFSPIEHEFGTIIFSSTYDLLKISKFPRDLCGYWICHFDFDICDWFLFEFVVVFVDLTRSHWYTLTHIYRKEAINGKRFGWSDRKLQNRSLIWGILSAFTVMRHGLFASQKWWRYQHSICQFRSTFSSFTSFQVIRIYMCVFALVHRINLKSIIA